MLRNTLNRAMTNKIMNGDDSTSSIDDDKNLSLLYYQF